MVICVIMLCDEGSTAGLRMGEVIRGRWKRHSYRLIRPLGKGANGEVWLVHGRRQNFALKLSTDPHGIALEFRLLKQMQTYAPNTVAGVREFHLGPFVYELDDMVADHERPICFYTMEYIEGMPLAGYISAKGHGKIARVIVMLLHYLQRLHAQGYAFGDLKADNILVHPVTGEVRLVDFGGLTRFGEGIRQYTEWYDRAYWGAGSRKADAAYDLFAVGMLIAQLMGADLISAAERDIHQLVQSLRTVNDNQPWIQLLEKAWHGGYCSAMQMQREVNEIKKAAPRQSASAKSLYNKMKKGAAREWDWSDWTVIGSMVVCLFLFLRLLMVQ